MKSIRPLLVVPFIMLMISCGWEDRQNRRTCVRYSSGELGHREAMDRLGIADTGPGMKVEESAEQIEDFCARYKNWTKIIEVFALRLRIFQRLSCVVVLEGWQLLCRSHCEKLPQYGRTLFVWRRIYLSWFLSPKKSNQYWNSAQANHSIKPEFSTVSAVDGVDPVWNAISHENKRQPEEQ